jgi:DNA end-binding protein Ku
MPRAMWKGSVTFGLVEIPVALLGAEEPDDLSFNQIDRRTMSRVGYKRVNKDTGEEVPWEEIVSGYEYEPNEYVIFSDEELKRANVRATQTIEIQGFVDLSEIDAPFFDRPYYLEPLKKNSKSYALLREALERTGKVGIARVVIRTRQHVAALMVRDDVLVLEILRYAHELRDTKDVDVPRGSAAQIGLSDKEIKMAEKLVEGMAEKWQPKQFKDEYRADVMATIEKKIKSGKTHTIEVPGDEESKISARSDVVDLMPLLKQSLDTKQGKKPKLRAVPARKKPRTA